MTERRMWLMAEKRTEICGLNVTCDKLMNLSSFNLKCLMSFAVSWDFYSFQKQSQPSCFIGFLAWYQHLSRWKWWLLPHSLIPLIFQKVMFSVTALRGAVRLGASAQTWTESAKHRHVVLNLNMWADPGYLLGPSFQKDTGPAVGLVSHLLASSGWSV